MKKNYTRNTPAVSFLLAVLLAVTQSVNGQNQVKPTDSERKMSLREALALTEESNFQIQMAEADVEIVRSQYRQTNAAFLPQLSIEETGLSTNDPLNVFGFRLKQQVVTTADFNPDRLNDPGTYENFTTKFEVRQPLLNADMLYKRSAVKNQVSAAKEQLEGTLQYARFQVKDTYYQLLLMQNRLETIAQSLEAARENERQAKNFFDEGIISKADYLAAKVRLLDLQSRQSQTEDQYQTIQDNFNYLLGLDENINITPTDSLQDPRYSPDQFEDIDDASNSGLEALRYRMNAAEQMVKSAKFNFVPTVNLFGNYEYNDDVLFGTRGDSYLLGATLKWNIFSGFSKVGKVMESKAELRKAEIAYENRAFKNKIEIRQAKRSIKQAQIQLNFAESSVEQAAEDFRIRNDRYEQGMEKTTDLLAAETKLAQARFQRLNALYQYHKSVATLELLLEQDLSY